MQKPWLFYILSTHKNTYIGHFHSTAAVLTFCSFSWRKTKTGLHISLQVSSRAITFLANCTSTLISDKKKIFLISVHSTPLSDCLHIMNGDFILCIHMFDAEVYRSSSCICSQSLDGKMEVKKNARDTHTQKRDELLSSKEPHVLHMVLL